EGPGLAAKDVIEDLGAEDRAVRRRDLGDLGRVVREVEEAIELPVTGARELAFRAGESARVLANRRDLECRQIELREAGAQAVRDEERLGRCAARGGREAHSEAIEVIRRIA